MRFNILIICMTIASFSHHVYSQQRYETYTDEVNGFSIEYISNWKILKSKYSDGGTNFLDQSSDPPQVAINVNKVRTDQSLESVSKAAKKYISEQPGASDVSILSENTITASNMEGIENIMTYKISGTEIFIKSAYLTNEGYVISISMAGSAKIIEEMQNSFKHMIETIELL